MRPEWRGRLRRIIVRPSSTGPTAWSWLALDQERQPIEGGLIDCPGSREAIRTQLGHQLGFRRRDFHLIHVYRRGPEEDRRRNPKNPGPDWRPRG